MTMDVSKKVKRSAGFVYNEVDGDLVMMDVEIGTYISMNPTGKDIWDILETPQTAQQIVDKLLGMYNIERVACEQEVTRFIETMQSRKIIVDC
jgi:Coenzyme PQQ synthesis protein D (PqqD)